jgi:hypothetical protein
MVKKAKKMGVCTQCLKLKRLKNRLQCQRCIDTNKRKREKRKALYAELQAKSYDYKVLASSKNPLREKIMAYAVEQGICTKCFGRPAEVPLRQCAICLERKRMWKLKAQERTPKKKKQDKPVDKTKQREYAKKYARKKLTKKVTSLDRIAHAVEQGKSIKVSTRIYTKK